MEKKRYRIMYYDRAKRQYLDLVVEATLDKALQQALAKGTIIEVKEINEKGDPLVEVNWKHLV